ncbi:MAG: hypothetical protein ACLGH0_05550, partial [Thermoanaerobaculia bacterium]
GVFAYRVTSTGNMTARVVEPVAGTNAASIRPYSPVSTTMPNGDAIVVWASGNAQRTELKSAILTQQGLVSKPRVLATFTDPVTPLHLMRAGSDSYVLSCVSAPIENGRNAIITATFHADGAPAQLIDQAAEVSGMMNVAAASNGNVTYIAYPQPSSWPGPVMGVTVVADGVAREAEVLSISRTRQMQPALAAAAGRMLAAWSDVAGTAAYVRTASLAPDGEPLQNSVVAPAYVAASELAWNGSEYLAIATRGTELLATRMTFEGAPIAEPILLGTHTNSWYFPFASVTWSGDRWLVLWETMTGLQFTTVSRTGVAAAPRPLTLTAPRPEEWSFYTWSATLASNGTQTLLVWSEEQMPPCYFPPCSGGPIRTFASRIDVDGTQLDATPLDLDSAYNHSIATSGEEFMILGDTTATAVDASASALRILGTRNIFDWGAATDVTWDGSTYAVALRYFGAKWRLAVAHLDRNANAVGALRGLETLPPDLNESPSIATIVPSAAVIAVQEGDAENGARAVV